MNARIEGRIERLQLRMAQLAVKIEAEPKHAKIERWKAIWLECQKSLERIRDTGQETLRTAPVGVEVDVPVAPFSVKGG